MPDLGGPGLAILIGPKPSKGNGDPERKGPSEEAKVFAKDLVAAIKDGNEDRVARVLDAVLTLRG